MALHRAVRGALLRAAPAAASAAAASRDRVTPRDSATGARNV